MISYQLQKVGETAETVAALKAKLEGEQERHKETREQLLKTQGELNEAKKELTKLRAENNAQLEKIKALENTVGSLRETIDQLNAQLAKLNDAIADLRAANDQLLQKHEALRDDHDRLNKEYETFSKHMKQAVRKLEARAKREHYTFVADQVIQVFHARLARLYLPKNLWLKKDFSSIEETREAIKDDKKLAEFEAALEEELPGMDEGEFSDVLRTVKEMRNSHGHPHCLDPDYLEPNHAESCECDPTPAEIEKAMNLAFSDRTTRRVLQSAIRFNDKHRGSASYQLRPY